jgi:hypothetical protein
MCGSLFAPARPDGRRPTVCGARCRTEWKARVRRSSRRRRELLTLIDAELAIAVAGGARELAAELRRAGRALGAIPARDWSSA